MDSITGGGPAATYADFPLMGRGPFGEAIRIRAEENPDFRPFLYVPRSRLHDSPLDIKGAGNSVTVVVWAAGVKGPDMLKSLDLELSRSNQLMVLPTLQTTRAVDRDLAEGKVTAKPLRRAA